MGNRRLGITAVEVMVSTLLASLLMVAMLSVLRGLKTQAAALEARLPVPAWQTTLNSVLQSDLENSRAYKLTNNSIVLRGFLGRSAAGTSSWKPSIVVYEIVNDGSHSWLVRRDMANQTPELVLANVTNLRVGIFVEGESNLPQSAPDNQPENPIVDGLVLEFWGSDQGGALYGYQFRRP